jgi:hypothetical protein
VTVIKCNLSTLTVADFLSKREFLAIALSDGVIIWNYKGLAMLVPPMVIKNKARMMEAYDKQGDTYNKKPQLVLQAFDTVKLPTAVGAALLYAT